MRLAWLTDIHLNFFDDAERRQFLETVAERADAVVITGDIGESINAIGFLKEMEDSGMSGQPTSLTPFFTRTLSPTLNLTGAGDLLFFAMALLP